MPTPSLKKLTLSIAITLTLSACGGGNSNANGNNTANSNNTATSNINLDSTNNTNNSLLTSNETSSNKSSLIKPVNTPYAITRPTPKKESGLNLDIARHFYSPTAIKSFIDTIADAGGTFLHLHLSDNENYALESELLGQTTANAIQRADGVYINKTTNKPFLSNAQIADIAQYAKSRQIELIPELDMPAHIKGVLDLFALKNGNGALTKIRVDYTDNQIDFQKTETKQFIKALIHEITIKFGDSTRHVHIGGDEFMRAVADNTQYIIFANEISAYLKSKGLGTRMWNDAVLKKSVSLLNNDIDITYWSRGWDKGEAHIRASLPEIIADGHRVLNYNGSYLYHIPEKHHYSSMSQSDHEMYTRLQEWHLGKWDGTHTSDIITDTSKILGAALSIWGEHAGDLSGESIAKFTHNQLTAIIRMTNAESNPASAEAVALKKLQYAMRQHDYRALIHPVYLDVSVAPQDGFLDTGALGTQNVELIATSNLSKRTSFVFYILGDNTDTLKLKQEWVATGQVTTLKNPNYAPDQVTYHAYSLGDDKLWVDRDIRVVR